MAAVRQRSAFAIAIAAAVAAFAIAFGVARGLAGDSSDSTAEPIQPLPAPAVSIENLERAPTIKPLRTAAGEAPPP